MKIINENEVSSSLTQKLFKPIILDNYKELFGQYALTEINEYEHCLDSYASTHGLSVYEMFKQFNYIFHNPNYDPNTTPFTDLELYAFETIFELPKFSKNELINNTQEYIKFQMVGDRSIMCDQSIIFLFLCFKNSIETILDDDEKLEEVVTVFIQIYTLFRAQFKVTGELFHYIMFVRYANIVSSLQEFEIKHDITFPVFATYSSDFPKFEEILTYLCRPILNNKF